jgi:hypothetical protein
MQVTDIIKGVTNIVLKVQAVLNDMESKYKRIWDTDKEAYMRRYRKNSDARDFDGDIKVRRALRCIAPCYQYQPRAINIKDDTRQCVLIYLPINATCDWATPTCSLHECMNA